MVSIFAAKEHTIALVHLFYRLLLEAEFRQDKSVTISKVDSRYKEYKNYSEFQRIFEMNLVIHYHWILLGRDWYRLPLTTKEVRE